MWQMHVHADDAHYIRLTVGKPRKRQVKLYEYIGATVEVEEVDESAVHPKARLRCMVRVDDGGVQSG